MFNSAAITAMLIMATVGTTHSIRPLAVAETTHSTQLAAVAETIPLTLLAAEMVAAMVTVAVTAEAETHHQIHSATALQTPIPSATKLAMIPLDSKRHL
jgi:hypothetical protein